MSAYAVRKCPTCCPHGGAICDYTRDVEGKATWTCRNCHSEMPRRTVRRTADKPNRRQQKIIDRVTELFGGSLATEMIGRKVFCTWINEARHWCNGQQISGAIGPRGKLELTLYRLGGDAKITDRFGLETYLTS